MSGGMELRGDDSSFDGDDWSIQSAAIIARFRWRRRARLMDECLEPFLTGGLTLRCPGCGRWPPLLLVIDGLPRCPLCWGAVL